MNSETQSRRVSRNDLYDVEGRPFAVEAQVSYGKFSPKATHRSLTVTGVVFESVFRPGEERFRHANGTQLWCSRGGCIHEDLCWLPFEVTNLIRWHQCTQEGPLHYIQNALFWAGFLGYCGDSPTSPPNFDNLKKTIVFGSVPEDDGVILQDFLDNKDAFVRYLERRLPSLLAVFRDDIEKFGFSYEESAHMSV